MLIGKHLRLRAIEKEDLPRFVVWLNDIFLRVDETNLGGIHCYEHTGFIHEGRQRQAKFEDGQYIDLLLMSVLRSEWQSRKTT